MRLMIQPAVCFVLFGPTAQAPAAVVFAPVSPVQAPTIIHIPFVGDIVQSHPIEHPDWPAQPVNEVSLSALPAQPPALPQSPIEPVQPRRIADQRIIDQEISLHAVAIQARVQEPSRGSPRFAATREALATAREALKPEAGEALPSPRRLSRVFDGAAAPAESRGTRVLPREDETLPPEPRSTRRRTKNAERKKAQAIRVAEEWDLEAAMSVAPDGESRWE